MLPLTADPAGRRPAGHQVSALSREAAAAKEGEARAREALATGRSEAAVELDKASLAVREAEEQERSVRAGLQVSQPGKLRSELGTQPVVGGVAPRM